MATTNRESIAFGTLQVNDGVNFEVESLTFTPAQKKPLFASNSDADGEALVRESHYTPATFDLQIRVVPQATADAARAKLGELSDAVQACEKTLGGQAVPWIPHDSETLYTAYAITGDITEVPMEITGDNAGWFLKAPVAKVHLTCRPFLYTAERTVLTTTESAAEPLQVRYIKGILGDVLAEARLIVTDKAAQDRRFAMWGRDVVTSETNPALLLPASTALTGVGFSGESKTRSGAYGSEKVLRGTAVSQATTLCGTGRIEDVGSYAIYLRVYSTSEASRFRISYRSGDGPLIPLEWKQPIVVNGWSELYVGSVAFDAVTLGAQTSEIRVEQKATEGNPANDVNYLMLWPSKVSGKARGIAVNTPTKLIAYDSFEQTAGALSGAKTTNGITGVSAANPGVITSAAHGLANGDKVWIEGVTGTASAVNGFRTVANVTTNTFTAGVNTTGLSYTSGGTISKVGKSAPLGGAWYGTGDANDFSVNATNQNAERTAINDPSITAGRFALLPEPGELTTVSMAVVVTTSSNAIKGRLGVFARYIDVNNWVMATLSYGSGGRNIQVNKCVAGVVTSLGFDQIATSAINLSFVVTANGSWVAASDGGGAQGQDASLAAGGALATGRVGIYDAWTVGGTIIRTIDKLQILGADEPGRVCYSGKQVEFNPQGSLRQDSSGAYDGPPSSYRGGGFYLEPEGKLGLINRVAVRMRRNDNDAEEDSVVTDKHAIEVKVRERFLLPR